MALRVDDMIDRARNRHPSFTPQLIPPSIGFDFVNETQRRLFRRIHMIDPDYLVQRWIVKLLPALDVAQVGAGLTGQAPLEIDADFLDRRLVDTGAAALVSATTSIYVQETVVLSASHNTVQAAAVSWTVNQWQNSVLQIVSGTGAGQQRDIAGNTSDTVTTTEDFDQIPDSTSTFLIREEVLSVDGSAGAVLGQQPNTSSELTYLVRLDSTGRPYVDLAQPVTVSTQLGIPLPPGQYINHGQVFFLDQLQVPNQGPTLTLVPMVARYSPPNRYCAAVQGRQLFLCPPFEQWKRVDHLEIPFLPIPPAIVSPNDYVTLPDDAEDALVGGIVLGMCDRISQISGATTPPSYGMPDPLAPIRQRAMDAETDYLALVTGAGRAEVDQFEDVNSP